MNDITIISSEKNWMEQGAINQLKQTASLPGVTRAIGLPDLHPGKTPVGAVLITEDIIYPHIIGNDIGCGMSLFMTSMEKRKFKLSRMINKLEELKNLIDIDISDMNICNSSLQDTSMGTIGRGNHFAELQETEAVFDPEQFEKIGFDKNQMFLLVHSGSRGYGQTILDEFIRKYQAQKGLAIGSEAATNYLSKHDDAVNWAVLNREMIASRLLRALGVSNETIKLVDSTHNSISTRIVAGKLVYIHRKGAAPADNSAIVIPGSRGSLTYLVMPANDTTISGYSLAHGAGRKWERSLCKSRLQSMYTKETIKYTKLRGRVICNDTNLLFEEAQEAYKNIDTIIQCLVDFGLIKIIATFKPLLTYKS